MGKVITDYHMHSQFSADAHTTMEEMCRSAVEHGLKEIVFTDHFEFYDHDFTGYREDEEVFFDEYFREIERCRGLFEGKLRILSGVEAGQGQIDPEYAETILGRYPFDYRIGSLHKLHNVDLAETEYYPDSLDSLARYNLQQLYRLAQVGQFDCMGHVDLMKRYTARVGLSINFMDYREELTEIFKIIIQRGKGIEINTSGLRQDVKEAFPSLEIVRLYRECGGEILTIGSDSHYARDVAAGLENAREIALAAGFTQLATFHGRKCSFYSIV